MYIYICIYVYVYICIYVYVSTYNWNFQAVEAVLVDMLIKACEFPGGIYHHTNFANWKPLPI